MNFLDRYHKAITPSGVNFGKDLMSFWYWTNLGLYLMYKSLYKSHKVVFLWTLYGWYGMSQVAYYFGPMLGRRRSCWADVGPLAAMFSRLLGSLHDGSLWWYCILLSVNLCIVYSYFHVCFICSLIIILCVIKTVQPTPLVDSEPGRYRRYSIQVMNFRNYSSLMKNVNWTAPDLWQTVHDMGVCNEFYLTICL